MEEIMYFEDYIEYYPDEDEIGYDGIHSGGIKGIRSDAPQKIKEDFKNYVIHLMDGLNYEDIKNGTATINSVQRIYLHAWTDLLYEQ